MAEGTRQRTIAKSKGKITDEMMLKVVSLKKVGVKTSTKKASGAGASKEDSKSQNSNSNSVVLDDNGNLHPNEDDCPFDIMCNFLQAIISKKYKDALIMCRGILVYEPGNEIAKEFLHVLEEMVAVNDDNRNGESATSGTILSKFHGKGDGGESHGGKSDSDSESSGSSASESEDEGGESNGTSSSSGTESSEDDEDTTSSSSEDGDNSQVADPLDKIFSSVDESENDGESETSSSVTSDSSISGDDDDDDEASTQLDTEISEFIEKLHGTFGSLDVQDTLDMMSSLDFEDDEDQYTSTYSGATIEDLGEVKDNDVNDSAKEADCKSKGKYVKHNYSK